MDRRILTITAILLFVSVISGCGSIWKCVPEKTVAINQYFDAALTSDQKAFYLTVKNKSGQNIELLWNKTLYIDPSGGTNGMFTFGTEHYYEDKDFKYPSTIIFSNSAIQRTLYPVANRYFARSGWYWTKISPGTNGLLLTVLIDGKEISEKMTFNLVSEKRTLF